MEINALIASINESTGDSQIELIDFMRGLIDDSRHVVIGDLTKLFLMLRSLLTAQTNAKIILATHLLIKSVSAIQHYPQALQTPPAQRV